MNSRALFTRVYGRFVSTPGSQCARRVILNLLRRPITTVTVLATLATVDLGEVV
jgi:hypothetical protein